MKILLIYPIDDYPDLFKSYGSIGRFVANMTKYISEYHELTLMTAKDLSSQINKESHIYVEDQHSCFSKVLNIKKFPKYIDKELSNNHYDLVMCIWWYSPLSIYKVIKSHHKDAIIVLNGSPLLGIPWPCKVLDSLISEWESYGNRIKIVCESNFQKISFEECGLTKINSVIYPSSPFLKTISNDGSRDSAGITIVSRIDPFKNIGLSIEAAGESGLPVILIGYPDGSNSKLYFDNTINPLIKKYDVSYIGKIPFIDTLKYTSISNCTIFTSMWEACPYQPVESMSVGTPVVCQKVGFMEELLSESSGIIVDTFRSNHKKRIKLMTEGILRSVNLNRSKVIDYYKSRFLPDIQYNAYLDLVNSFQGESR